MTKLITLTHQLITVHPPPPFQTNHGNRKSSNDFRNKTTEKKTRKIQSSRVTIQSILCTESIIKKGHEKILLGSNCSHFGSDNPLVFNTTNAPAL
jgi:hypothetical protein